MYFSTKNYLKSTHNYTTKHARFRSKLGKFKSWFPEKEFFSLTPLIKSSGAAPETSHSSLFLIGDYFWDLD
jgi:hypothetical protein